MGAGTRSTGARASSGDVVAMLEALPLPARDLVVRLLAPAADDDVDHDDYDYEPLADAICSLPLVSQGTLSSLQELRLPIGRFRPKSASKVEEAVRQAHALRRAWELGTLHLSWCSDVHDVSALAGCATLHTLDLSWCLGLTDVSPLATCAKLHKLELMGTNVKDVSALAGCARLHTLGLHAAKLTDVSGLAGCAALHTLILECTQVADVSALGGFAALHTLDLSYCYQVTDVSALAGCVTLRTLKLDRKRTGMKGVSALESVSIVTG